MVTYLGCTPCHGFFSPFCCMLQTCCDRLFTITDEGDKQISVLSLQGLGCRTSLNTMELTPQQAIGKDALFVIFNLYRRMPDPMFRVILSFL